MVERACDERGQSGFVYAMRRFYAQAPQLSSGVNFDLAGAHPGLETGLRERSGSVDNATVSTAKREPCHGHFKFSPSNSPSESGPPKCEQVSANAKILPPRFTNITGISLAMALHILPSGNSFFRHHGRNFDGNL
jgi:hypothetical protein